MSSMFNWHMKNEFFLSPLALISIYIYFFGNRRINVIAVLYRSSEFGKCRAKALFIYYFPRGAAYRVKDEF